MYKKILRLTALLAFLLLLAGACIAGLAAALPDTFYTADAPTALQVASMPYLTAQKKQGSVAADSASIPIISTERHMRPPSSRMRAHAGA